MVKEYFENKWRKILLEIYNYSPNYYGETPKVKIDDDNHSLAKKFKISGEHLELTIKFLLETKLITQDKFNIKGKHYSHFNLTEKGFDVSQNLIKHSDNITIQVGIFLFTAMIVLTGAFQFLKELVSDQYNFLILIIYLLSILAVGILGFYHKKKLP